MVAKHSSVDLREFEKYSVLDGLGFSPKTRPPRPTYYGRIQVLAEGPGRGYSGGDPGPAPRNSRSSARIRTERRARPPMEEALVECRVRSYEPARCQQHAASDGIRAPSPAIQGICVYFVNRRVRTRTPCGVGGRRRPYPPRPTRWWLLPRVGRFQGGMTRTRSFIGPFLCGELIGYRSGLARVRPLPAVD